MSDAKYKEGDSFCINGKNWTVLDYPLGYIYRLRGEEKEIIEIHQRALDAIGDYEPPKKEEVVHEWLPWVQVPIHLHYGDSISSQSVQDMAKSINKLLTNWYGAPPIARTYNGEEAEEFGLEDSVMVLYWLGDRWSGCSFGSLDRGEKWMAQPPKPKEEDEAWTYLTTSGMPSGSP